VDRITENGLVANGIEYKVDCIVYASGFEITTDFKRRFGLEAIEGRDGRSLYDTWTNGYKTLHGFMVHGFPNQFHTGFTQVAVVGSITLMFEHQARHISYIIGEALKRGVATVEPSQEAQDAWLRHSRETSVFNPQFAEECTPSYFNGEGAETTRSPLFGDLYGLGYEVFEEMLQSWRDKGDMAGLTLGA
jgi:cyclohexanone monooxygenase